LATFTAAAACTFGTTEALDTKERAAASLNDMSDMSSAASETPGRRGRGATLALEFALLPLPNTKFQSSRADGGLGAAICLLPGAKGTCAADGDALGSADDIDINELTDGSAGAVTPPPLARTKSHESSAERCFASGGGGSVLPSTTDL